MKSFILSASLLVLSTVANANSTSCRGQGSFSDVYISITSGLNSTSDHVCINDKEQYATSERVWIDRSASNESFQSIQRLSSSYYSTVYRGKVMLIPRRTYSQTFKIRRLSSQEAQAIYTQAQSEEDGYEKAHGTKAPFNYSNDRVTQLMNAQTVTFVCDSLEAGNYHAPCDLKNEAPLVQNIVSGRQAPLSKKQVAAQIAQYYLELMSDKKYDRVVEEAVDRTNSFRFPDVIF